MLEIERNLMTDRDIIHADIDAFLASVEQVRDPSLRGRPVVVGGAKGERGLVLSASYEARRRGVFPGLTLAQAERILPGAAYRRGDYNAGKALSDRVFSICGRHTPLVEVTSLDDCYLDVTGTDRLFGPAVSVAERIREAVRREVGFSLSLGVGESRTVARVATAFAKPGGVLAVPRGMGAAFLAPLPVRRLPGIGPAGEALLHRLSVRTIGEFARIPPWILGKAFGEAVGAKLLARAWGRDAEPVRPLREPRSVSRETSFSPETADRRLIEAMLYYLLERAAAALRREGRRAKTVAVKIRYADGPGDARSRALDRPADNERDMWEAARGLLDALFTRRVRLKLVGVALSGFLTGEDPQGELFPDAGRRKRELLAAGVDRIRERFGFAAITAGRSIELLGRFPRDENGFVLKTPSLTR
jgi:DNA polymerase IV